MLAMATCFCTGLGDPCGEGWLLPERKLSRSEDLVGVLVSSRRNMEARSPSLASTAVRETFVCDRSLPLLDTLVAPLLPVPADNPPRQNFGEAGGSKGLPFNDALDSVLGRLLLLLLLLDTLLLLLLLQLLPLLMPESLEIPSAAGAV